MNPTISAAVLFLALSRSLVVTGTQTPTLPERVASTREKTLVMTMMEESAPLPIAELSARADLVAEGQLIRSHSYLSDDKTTIYTDYQILPNRVLRTRLKDASATPGPRPHLVLTVQGGEIVLDGTTIKLSNYKLRPIRNGGRFLVFASTSKPGENRLSLTGGSAGIFEVLGGDRLQPLLNVQNRNAEVEGMSLEDIVRKIRAAPIRE